MKSASYHLPFFLEHYRNLGISSFLIYNDSSDDGTSEQLLSQDDVTVITSDIPFSTVVNGERWISVLKRTVPNALVKKGWVIIADADEYLILPSDFESIIELIGYMEGQGNNCASASPLEFYPEYLSKRSHPPDLSPQSQCRYFDKSNPSSIRARLHRLLKQHHEQEYDQIFEAEGAGLSESWKVPLLQCGTAAAALNQHEGAIAPPDNVRMALGRYKFTPDLDAKTSNALSAQADYGGTVEYESLESALRHFEGLSPRARIS